MTQSKGIAFVFPGQGSQSLAMMQDFADNDLVRDVYQQASTRLGFDLWELTQQGPQDKLNQTQYTQPALLTASIALWQLWQQKSSVRPAWLAGHSLGEYSALVAAQAMDFADAVELVHARGVYMQEAVAQDQGAMAAIIGLDIESINTACRDAAQNDIVQAANLNSYEQTVIAGDKAAVERACAILKEMGAKRALMLPVSVPSHCALMKPAADRLQEKLAHVAIQTPKVPVLHNVDTQTKEHPEEIRAALIEQLYKPVQWCSTVERLNQHLINHVVECGPGKVLSGLIKRIAQDIHTHAIGTQSGLDTCMQTLEQSR